MSNDHPLHGPQISASLTWAGVAGGMGIALMLAGRLALVGFGISSVASVIILWPYKTQFARKLFNHSMPNNRAGLATALASSATISAIALYLLINPASQVPPEQMARAIAEDALQMQALASRPFAAPDFPYMFATTTASQMTYVPVTKYITRYKAEHLASNAIGAFKIGVSPIGAVSSHSYLATEDGKILTTESGVPLLAN